jgi:anti-sigma factor ChrR (cupin superfamily)
MPGRIDDEQNGDQALLYAMGVLTADERDAFEARIASGDVNAAELESLQQSMVAAVLAAEPAPRPLVKDRLLASVKNSRRRTHFEEPEPGVMILRSGDGRWIDTGYRGVTYQMLHLDKESRMATTILKLEPGAKYPPHRHTTLEQCWVIRGDARLGNLQIFEGDFEKAMPGTDHGIVTSDTGCELLIISCVDDEIHTL